MKKILIVNKSFETGGIQTSLINMVNELQNYYQVDLYIYCPEGPMKDRLHPAVNILPSSWRLQALGMSLKDVVATKKIRLILYRIYAAVLSKLLGNEHVYDNAIKHEKKLTGYDIAIAYHQEQRRHSVLSGFSRFVDRCVEAKCKVAWFHYDNTLLDLDSTFNNKFYRKMDKLVFVSDTLAKSFAAQFPEFKEKVDYCYNVVDYAELAKKSADLPEVHFADDKFVCFSACRLSKEKALVRAITVLQDVFKHHSELMWYIAGDGVEKENIEAAIVEKHLERQIVLMGYQSNPYAFMARADLLMNVSYHEAAPMVFLEAKAIGTPVFATRTSSADELLKDGIDSFICDNDENSMRESFERLITQKQLIQEAKRALQMSDKSNADSLRKISSWLN